MRVAIDLLTQNPGHRTPRTLSDHPDLDVYREAAERREHQRI